MNKKILIIIVLCILNVSLMVFILTQNPNNNEEIKTKPSKENNNVSEKVRSSSFSFIGVGDNLYHGALSYNQMMAGQGYNFDDYYAQTMDYTKNADLAYINFETLALGEEDGYPLQSYPCFNGPIEILSAVHNAGFDWWAMSSNHSLDMGSDGLLLQLEKIRTLYPDVVTTGSHSSQKDKDTCIVKEVNGIKVGLLGYTYGLNGFEVPDDMPWLVDLIDKDQMKEDMEALSKVSDVQIVSMHWGQEYQYAPNEEQEDLANYLNELGAEVIIGSHPHVIQPAEIIHSKNQDTLVYYSLGNYISAQDSNDTMVGGMASFTLNYDFDTKKVSFSDPEFIPLVTYYDVHYNHFGTYVFNDYTDELAMNHYLSTSYDMSKAWMKEFVSSVMDEDSEVKVVYE